jgi:cytochrome b561
MTSRLPRFHPFAMLLHWLVAAALVAQFSFGWWLTTLPDDARAAWVGVHRSVGVVIMAVILVRLAWRLACVPPAQYPTVPHAVGWIAELSHAIVYAALVLVPLTGLLGTLLGGEPFMLFGATLRGSGAGHAALGDFFRGAHAIAAWTLAGLVALHVAAALWHLVRGDGAFWRMFPRRAR